MKITETQKAAYLADLHRAAFFGCKAATIKTIHTHTILYVMQQPSGGSFERELRAELDRIEQEAAGGPGHDDLGHGSRDPWS